MHNAIASPSYALGEILGKADEYKGTLNTTTYPTLESLTSGTYVTAGAKISYLPANTLYSIMRVWTVNDIATSQCNAYILLFTLEANNPANIWVNMRISGVASWRGWRRIALTT